MAALKGSRVDSAALPAAGPIRAFCIGHQPPQFVPPLPYTLLCPAPLGVPGEVVIADERFGPGVDGGALAEYSQLFGLADRLQAGELQAERLYLFQYRKFLGLRPGGGATNAPWLRVLRPANAALFFPGLDELQTLPQPVVVGALQGMGASVAANYAEAHVVDDFANFTACLAADGMPLAEVKRFASLQGFIPSPALCLVTTPLFLQHMAVLQRVWRLFTAHCAVARSGYQRRVAGYLLERLHSHLLLQGLHSGSQPDVGVAHRFVVLEPEAPGVPGPQAAAAQAAA